MAASSDHEVEPSITEIDPSGDLYLEVEEGAEERPQRYLVASEKLRTVSIYFENLLDPTKFKEGAHVAAQLRGLRSGANGRIVGNKLPALRISDIPNPSSSPVRDVLQCFLEIVHEPSIEGKAQKISSRKLPMSFITRLAIVADRFLALKSIKPSIDAYHRIQQPSKETFRLVYSLQNEQYWRQRLLVGTWFGYSNWVFQYSRLLIQHGSEYWSRIEAGDDEADSGSALWAHIPWGIEEEMMQRRSCVLATISSLQDFYLNKYLSGKRQCKLGYDSSPQCDSFQLGEMVRFFHRKELLTVQSTIGGQDWKASFGANLLALLKTLRQCTSYQIDSNHAHCGIRTHLVPRVEYLESWISDPMHIGICIHCWQTERRAYSWLENPSKGIWRWHQRSFLNSSTPFCDRQHKPMKDVFTSEERDWSPEML